MTSTTYKIIYSTVVIGIIVGVASLTPDPKLLISTMALVLAVYTRAELSVASLILNQMLDKESKE